MNDFDDRLEAMGALDLADLVAGQVLVVNTMNSTYRFRRAAGGDGEALEGEGGVLGPDWRPCHIVGARSSPTSRRVLEGKVVPDLSLHFGSGSEGWVTSVVLEAYITTPAAD